MASNKKIVFVGKRTKNWAIGCEIASNLAKTGNEVLLCDFSRFSGIWRPISLSRNRDQNHISSSFGIRSHKLKANDLGFSLISFKKTIRILQHGLDFYRDSDLYRIMLCHYASRFGTPEMDLKDIPKLSLFSTIYRIITLQASCSKFLSVNQEIDCIYIFNGRELAEATIISEIRKRKYKIKIYERASNSNRYEIYDSSPHNNEEWWQKIARNSQTVSDSFNQESKLAAERYIRLKMNGIDPFTAIKWKDYLDSSVNDFPELPSRYVVFFSVSTSEFSPFPEYNSKAGFSNQFVALGELIEAAKLNDINVVVRRHPNSIGRDKIDREMDYWKPFLSDSSVVYFPPTSRVNSYDLAEKSLSTFTWRSTIGFDMLCRGIPSYALGPAKWALDDRLRAWDRKSLDMVLQENYVFPDVSDLIQKYSFYMANFGKSLEEFDFIERWGYKLRNQRFKRNYLFQRILGIPRTR
jgi:hypothetical protein